MDFLKNRPLYLASRSPRRRQILEWAGVPHTVIDIDISETWPEGMSPFEVPRYLAKMKAREAMPRVPKGGIVLTADSVVILGNQVFGKPTDRRDAYRMLAHLSGKVHQVVTGVCLATQDKELVFDSTTDVFFRPLTHEEIEHYLDEYKPFDRAGAYGIQDWLGLAKISRIEGSFYNVMGLPMDLVYEALAGFEP
jgi:septum formation protein